ncbi:hypothetical protein N657DRAFT_648535 [Parathielavia appendiculata]|uniref:Uncharacterized protein n=1 Tax=Parathielavia appendiculata TaxID=2587402 RepID=A0AAN6Z0C5_9PEZI|nr:hypothetical protein N657DRAFT_648535 [Parathielavia appendiculata]
MLSIVAMVIPLGLLLRTASGTREHDKHTTSTYVGVSTIVDYVTVIETKTSTHWVDVSINSTVINTVTLCSTEIETKTLTETITEEKTTTITNTTTTTVTDTASVTLTETDTKTTTAVETVNSTTTTTAIDTDSVTLTETDYTTTTAIETANSTTTTTDTATVTSTATDTDSVTLTETKTTGTTTTTTDTTAVTETDSVTISTTTTRTIFSTTYDPCPKSCSISADTVRLFFWPTDRPFTYPSTHVHPTFGYTFTSPSVYMLIPTAVGTNIASATVGPSTTSWLLPLQLHEVSTIAAGNATRQLTLSDLRTDCPQNVAVADPTAIAELDPRCNPVLAAPSQVRSWAYPCNACGRFGMFDPPYAVPTLTGRLVETTSTLTSTLTFVTPTVTPPTAPSSAAESSVVVTTTRISTGVVESATGAPGSSGGSVGLSSVLGVTPDEGASVTGDVPSSSLGATSSVVATAAGSRPGLGGELGMWLVPVLGTVILMV